MHIHMYTHIYEYTNAYTHIQTHTQKLNPLKVVPLALTISSTSTSLPQGPTKPLRLMDGFRVYLAFLWKALQTFPALVVMTSLKK